MIPFSPFTKKMALLTLCFWSAGAYASLSAGQCNPISVTTQYVSLRGQSGKIPTGTEFMDSSFRSPIGKIVGHFNFTCKTHTSAPSNNISLGIFFSGSSRSFISGPSWGTEGIYKSNIDGLVLRLPPKSDVAGTLTKNTGMRTGTYGGESRSILLERYGWGGDYKPNDIVRRSYSVTMFYVHKNKNVSSSASTRLQNIWLSSPVRFSTYLHEQSPQSVWHSNLKIQGPTIELYDPSCRKEIPSFVEFDSVTRGGEGVSKNFKLGIFCPNVSTGGTKNISYSFDVVKSSSVSFDPSNPTFASYSKDGVKVNLQLFDNSTNKNVVFGRKTKLPSFGTGNRFEVPFAAHLKANNDSKSGNYEINVISTIEYN